MFCMWLIIFVNGVANWLVHITLVEEEEEEEEEEEKEEEEVKWYWKRKTEILGDKDVSAPLFPPWQ